LLAAAFVAVVFYALVTVLEDFVKRFLLTSTDAFEGQQRESGGKCVLLWGDVVVILNAFPFFFF
jgi:hypothetical protein